MHAILPEIDLDCSSAVQGMIKLTLRKKVATRRAQILEVLPVRLGIFLMSVPDDPGFQSHEIDLRYPEPFATEKAVSMNYTLYHHRLAEWFRGGSE